VICTYFYSPEHAIEDCPNLLKKCEEKKRHCNMVHVEPCKNKKKDKEVEVWVITRNREKTGRDFEQDESLGQKSEGKIIKAAYPPPKFDVSQQN
jgi:hypothetical protein